MSNTPLADAVREFVIAGHGNLDKVKQMLAEQPDLLNVAHEWKPGDTETALQGASHVGNRPVAEYLLEQGAPMEIYTAAMLGRQYDVVRLLDGTPGLIHAHGAHGIPLLTHAVLSGDVALVAMLYDRGAREGVSPALLNAVTQGHVELTQWLLQHAQPDLTTKNFQGKTALEIADERGDQTMMTLLRGHAT